MVFIARDSGGEDAHAQSRTALFFTWNGATAALLLGLWLGNMTIIGLAGLLLMASVVSLSKTAWIHFGKAAGLGAMYRIALAALLGGLATGIAMAFRLTDGFYAHARLGHIHLIVLGCLIVALHQLMPLLLRTTLGLGALTRFALWVLPAGFAVLLGAFLLSTVWLQIAVGCLLFASITLCTVQLVATWLKAGSPGTAATGQ